MLPASYQQAYEHFAQQLEHLQPQVTRSQPHVPDIQAGFLAVQQEFQQQIVPLTATAPADLPAGALSRLTACNTEINKHLRLLAMDISFLRAARQPQTVQQRQAQIRDRLQRLATYARLEFTEAE